MPFEEAEEWKLAAGSDEPGFRVDWGGPRAAGRAAGARATTWWTRCAARWPSTARSATCRSRRGCSLSGATARLPGIAGQLAEMLEFPVSVFDPFADLGGAARARVSGGPQFAQAFGLALRTS